jgi:restriction system protein
VGVSAIQEIHAAKSFYGADEAWVVASSSFTKAATKLASSAGVQLKILKLRQQGD